MPRQNETLKHVVRIHRRVADGLAVDLLQFCSTVWPDAWYSKPQNMAAERLFAFVAQAYRINEIVGIGGSAFCMEDHARSVLAVDQNETYPWLFDYHFALNRIRHCVSFEFGNLVVSDDQKRWKSVANQRGGFVVVSTMKHPEKVAIPIFPLGSVYMDRVRTKVDEFLS